MSHDLEDSVATHALHALPQDEELIVEAAIHVDPDLSAQYDSHRKVAAKLAEGFPEITPAMSPDLWQRIRQGAGLEESAADLTDPTTHKRRSATWLLGAAALVTIVALSMALLSSRTADPSLADLAAAAADQPGALTVSLEDPGSARATMSAVVSTDGEGYLISEDLPALAADRTYQLWVLVDDRIISAGILGSNPDVNVFRVEGDLRGLAVTEEVAGGVVASENDPIALWLAEV